MEPNPAKRVRNHFEMGLGKEFGPPTCGLADGWVLPLEIQNDSSDLGAELPMGAPMDPRREKRQEET